MKTILFPYEKSSITAITGPHFRNASLKSNPKSKILKSLYSTSAVLLYYNSKQNKTKYKNQSAESCSNPSKKKVGLFRSIILLLKPTTGTVFSKKIAISDCLSLGMIINLGIKSTDNGYYFMCVF